MVQTNVCLCSPWIKSNSDFHKSIWQTRSPHHAWKLVRYDC